jgi:uncharacterized protein with GYD domain
VPLEIRRLIRNMSLANPLWGAPRIHGELLKLGIDVGQTSVAKYMARGRRGPSQGWRTFLILMNWTDQGVRNVKESPKRLDAGREAAKKLGAEIKDFYMTMGDCDLVAHLEAPNDETVAKYILGLARGGNVRTRTLKAFSEEDYRKIIGSLS